MRHTTLAAARKRARRTIASLAKETGLNRMTITRLEKGKTLPEHTTAVLLEKALGLEPGSLKFAKVPQGAAA